MAAQGSYPLGDRTVGVNDTVTGVVSGKTADIPISALAALINPSTIVGNPGVIVRSTAIGLLTGAVSISTASSVGNGGGAGTISITGGDGGASTISYGGRVNIQAGNSGDSGGDGGNATLRAGASKGSTGVPGLVVISAGSNLGSLQYGGGTVQIIAGSVTSGNANAGGDIVLTPGGGGTGGFGTVNFENNSYGTGGPNVISFAAGSGPGGVNLSSGSPTRWLRMKISNDIHYIPAWR